ncbi:hypothetical protein GQ457_09G011390 [Hibiscus cannabinus]
MDETNQAKGKSTTQNETNVEELLDSEGSDYCPSEHEDSASEFFDSDNNHGDAADEVSDGHVTGSVLESLGYHPTNIGYNSDDGDSDDDVQSLHSLSSENSGNRKINRFPEFNTELDMKTPVLKNKLLFASKEILKEAMRQYGRVKRFNMSFKKNDKKRLQAMIIDARDKPILTMMEIIRTKMMQRISKKAEAAQKYTGLLCPKIQKKVDALIEQAARCWPSHAGALRYEVAFGPSDQHVVDLEAGVCSCRKWDLTGIPCAHVISAMLSIQRIPENYVDSCYHRTTQINLYSNYIFPIRGANQWEQVPEMESLPILPPIQRRPTGRPKKKRRKAADEQDNGPSRGHRTLEIKCSKCGKPGHNIRSCRGQVGVTAPPTFSTDVPPITAPLTRIIPKLPFKRPVQTIQVPSHSTPTIQRRKIKMKAGRQFSQVQPTQHQPTPYQVVRWMMQSTPCDNVLPNSQESTGSFKPKNN